VKNLKPIVAKRPFTVYFDVTTGITDQMDRMVTRRLSDYQGMFLDDNALEEMLKKEDKVVCNFTELGLEEVEENLLFGTSIVYPGKVGKEYFMTKGHFHAKINLGEVYYCLSGDGMLVMETPDGDTEIVRLKPGVSVFVPGRWAHRSVNIGNAPLVTFYVFRADAGHDYETIKVKGFRKLVIENNGEPAVIDNPKWKGLSK